MAAHSDEDDRLDHYRKKRDFSRSSEPTGRAAKGSDATVFVIHKDEHVTVAGILDYFFGRRNRSRVIRVFRHVELASENSASLATYRASMSISRLT